MHGFGERQRHGGGRGVGVAIDGDHHPLHGKIEFAGGTVQNPLIGLVRHHPIDVAWSETVGSQGLLQHRRQIGDRMTEDFPPLHAQMPDRLAERRPAIHLQQRIKTSVRMQVCREDSAILAGAATLFAPQHDRAGAIAEQDAGGTIIPVENAREGLGPNHQGGARLAGFDKIIGNRERVDEAGADRLNVEGGTPIHAERGLHLGGGGGKCVVGRGGRQNDQVECGGRQIGVAQRLT